MGPHDPLADILKLILDRAKDPMGSVFIAPPAHEHAIRQMQCAARRDLGDAMPPAYVALLRITNGLQLDNAIFKCAEHLVPENLDAPHRQVIVLGVEGNMAEFVFDRRDRLFHTINLGHPDERFDTFDDLPALLAHVLAEQQIID